MPAPAGQLHLELVDDEEIVVGRVLKINEPHRLITPEIPIRQAVNLRALEQQLGRRLVDFHQAMALGLFQLFDDAANTIVIEPWLAVAQVQLPQCRCQSAFEQHLAEVLALGEIGNIRVALNPLPAHRLELFAKRLLGQVVFPLDFAHGWVKCRSSIGQLV